MFSFTTQTVGRRTHRTDINGKQHWNYGKRNGSGKVNVKWPLLPTVSTFRPYSLSETFFPLSVVPVFLAVDFCSVSAATERSIYEGEREFEWELNRM